MDRGEVTREITAASGGKTGLSLGLESGSTMDQQAVGAPGRRQCRYRALMHIPRRRRDPAIIFSIVSIVSRRRIAGVCADDGGRRIVSRRALG